MRKYLLSLLLLCGFSSLHAAPSVSDTNQTDAKGRKQGLWIRVPEKNRVGYTGRFKDDMPQGRFLYVKTGDTVVAEAFYFRGGYASYNQFFYPDGTLMAEGYYLDKRKDSVWKMYAPGGRLVQEEHFKDGHLHGERILYAPDGRITEKQNWFRGLRNGAWFVHDEQGYQYATYKLNLSHGAYKVFYPDSTRFIEGTYDEGLKQGKWSFYLPSGSLYKEDTYRNNILQNRLLYLKINSVLRPIGTDTVPMVMRHPQGGRAELLASSGHRWVCDEKFETVCGILDMDFYFYANPNTLVSFSALDMAALPALMEEAEKTDAQEEKMDGQQDPMRQLGRNASVTPLPLPLRIQTPFPVYVDANGLDVLRNNLSKAALDAE